MGKNKEDIEMGDVRYFKTNDNEFLRIERFDGETFKIYTGNHPESFSQCQSLEVTKQVGKGSWIEISESRYLQHWEN